MTTTEPSPIEPNQPNPVADRVHFHLKAATPILLGLATTVVSDFSHPAIDNPTIVMRSLLGGGPPPKPLLAKGLRLLAETAHDLADALADALADELDP